MPLHRRSRITRTPAGKKLSLTPRDVSIFRALARYRYLRSTYLHAFAGGASETRFKERLGNLFHEGFLDRPKKQWEFANARYAPAVYELGERARRLLREHEGDIAPYTFFADAAHRQFAHSVLTCECLASFDLAVREKPRLRFIPWPEMLAKAPESTRALALPFRIPGGASALIPDGLFGVEYAGTAKSYRFFALELDRGTMPLRRTSARNTSLLGKLATYRDAIASGAHRNHLGVPNLLVLTVLTDPARLQTVLGEQGIGPAFLFKAVPAARLVKPDARLVLEPWARAGHAPLSIAET